MAGKYSEDIFILIKSLSKSEKRYFKYYSSMGSAKESDIYLRLFDAIDLQKKYNEKKILGKITDIKKEYLSSKKNYLKERILESLQWYHSGRSVDAQLWSFISKIKILYDKSLYKPCAQQIKKAKKLALRYEKHNQLSEIIRWEEQILITSVSGKNEGADILSVLSDNILIAGKIKEEAEYRLLSGKVSGVLAKGGIIRNKEMLPIFRKIIKHPLMKDDKTPSSFYGRYYYFRVLGAYYHTMKNWKNSYMYHKKIIEDFNSNRQYIDDSPTLYSRAIFLFLSCCIRTRNEKEFNATCLTLDRLMNNSIFSCNNNNMTNLLLCQLTILVYYIESGEFQKGLDLIYKIEGPLNKLSGVINKGIKFNFYYTFALYYFGAEKYKNSLLWLNKIMNEKDTMARRDIVTFARLFNLIVHFELGNERELDNYTKHAYRFLMGKDAIYKIEAAILEFIQKKLSKINSKSERVIAFKELKLKVEIIAKDPFEKQALEYFDFISWIESKIVGEAFADIVKRKWGKVREVNYPLPNK